MPNILFPKGFSEEFSTKRGQVSGAKRTAPVAYLDEVRSSPILPLDPTEQQEVFVRGMSIDCRVYCDPADVEPEDILIMGGEEFVVVEVGKWPYVNPRVLEVSLRKYQKP